MSIVPPEIEQDTAEAEDAYKVSDLIFPPANFLYERDLVSFSVNNKLLRGWVKQPSPCCAAAAVAGAWNALGGMERTHPKAIHHRDVLEIYCEILRGQIDRLSQSFERKLGAGHNSFQIIYAAVTDEMSRAAASEQAQGMPPPKKEKKVTRAAVGHAVKVAICSHRASLPPPSPSREAVSTMEPMECMHPLLCLEELIHAEVMEAKISLITDVVHVPSDSVKSKRTAENEEDNAFGGEEEEDDEEDDEDEEAVIGSDDPVGFVAGEEVAACGSGASAGTLLKKDSVRKKSGIKTASGKWNWRFELAGILNKCRGLKRLEDPVVPSTTIIGNWGILEGAPRLAEARGLGSSGFQATLLMGKKLNAKCKIEAPLSAKDSKEKITQQWNILRSAFQRDDCVLLFHLKNHYALIYALKEWVERDMTSASDITHKRQVLTARRGQRPSAWIDFEEVRSQMISWEGHKIMMMTRGKDTHPLDLQNAVHVIQILNRADLEIDQGL